MRDYLEEGVCPDCEDPTGFDTCTECGSDADGVYDDAGFVCFVCCQKEAERSFDPRFERCPVQEEWELPF